MAKFNTGDRVKHKTFGEGDIVEVSGIYDNTILTILFDNIDEPKKIKASFIKLIKK
tara:strand:- start:171 stop:338 length:168 start_codon:yes stop_codon:yes gene_type:complete